MFEQSKYLIHLNGVRSKASVRPTYDPGSIPGPTTEDFYLLALTTAVLQGGEFKIQFPFGNPLKEFGLPTSSREPACNSTRARQTDRQTDRERESVSERANLFTGGENVWRLDRG